MNITNPFGLSVASSVSVEVNQTVTGVTVTPASVSRQPGHAAIHRRGVDQFGAARFRQPQLTWSATIGSIFAPACSRRPDTTTGTVTATSGSIKGTRR